jgi:tRNA A37 N6-isopentenylltransferase MiaA
MAARSRCLRLGLVKETQRLLEQYGGTASPLSSLGYKQAVQFLQAENSHGSRHCNPLSKLIAIMPSGR